MPLLTDTTQDAEHVLARIYGAMSPARKIALLDDAWANARRMHAAGVRLRRPDATSTDIENEWRRVSLGRAILPGQEAIMPDASNPSACLLEVIRILDRLGIRYALGGSMASSIHGKPRFTHDADLSADLPMEKVQAFLDSLDVAYYLSRDAVMLAIQEHGSFNIIHTSSGFKLDVFLCVKTEFENAMYARRQQASVGGETVFVMSAEDILLYKLDWFRRGGEISDRQWSDILGVLQVQGNRLDQTYLETWAASLGVADLLRKARGEVV